MSITKSEPDVTSTPGDVERIAISDAGLAKLGVDINLAHKDKALALLEKRHIAFDHNSPEAKRVLRKIDMRIMPMLFFSYVFMLMDKNTLSFAAIMGIKKDTHLTADEYSWLGSLLYFGYLAGDVPATWLLHNFPLAKVLALIPVCWGIIECLHAACTNYASLAVLRFFLGVAEVGVAPAVIFLFSSWYTRQEQVSRVAIWYTCYGFSNIFGGFFAWCFIQAPSFNWRGLYIFEGLLAIVLGLVLWLFLAASPTDAKWLTEEEKVIALERLRDSKQGTEIWKINWSQLKEAFIDIRFWLIFFLDVALGLPLGGVTVFGPTIIANFGFNPSQTALLSLATGAASLVVVIGAGILAKYTNRTVAGTSIILVSVIGCIMMLAIPPKQNGARYAGYLLSVQFANAVPFYLAFITGGVSGTTKKFAFAVSYQMGYTVGNFIGPKTYVGSDAPNYYTAKYTMLAFLIFNAVLLASIGITHMIWNKKRDKQDALDAQNGVVHPHVENEEFADLTDFQMRSFRYPV